MLNNFKDTIRPSFIQAHVACSDPCPSTLLDCLNPSWRAHDNMSRLGVMSRMRCRAQSGPDLHVARAL